MRGRLIIGGLSVDRAVQVSPGFVSARFLTRYQRRRLTPIVPQKQHIDQRVD